MMTLDSVRKQPAESAYGLRQGAEEFPLMVVISVIYPCNLGCPNCPYTDGNSEIRRFYHERGGDLMPEGLWKKMALECGDYGAWMRCTGGGEPMLHPKMIDMVGFAKERGARVWMNTNGSMFGPMPQFRAKLEALLTAGIDMIEFSMDASDAETYAVVRPPHGGPPRDAARWWANHVDNVRAALEMRARQRSATRLVVSVIQQDIVRDRLEEVVDFWLKDVGVDEVITRKFLSWDDNTTISLDKALDPHLYEGLATDKKEPCVWPFERLNVDTLGRIALCGQDIAFRTAELFPNVNDTSLKEIWNGATFTRYRELHLDGRGAEAFPCRGCSAWLAGVRDWEHGWLKVLRKSGRSLEAVMAKDLGADVNIYQPPPAAREPTG